MALDDVQWPCIECRIKEEHFNTYRAELESRIHIYKRKYLLSHTLIEKYKEKCIECENLYQQLEKCVGMLANYKWRMGCALRTTFPMRSTLKETRDELVSVQSQLVSESEAHNATRQHSTQLRSQVSKLEEKISQLEKDLEESKGTARSLQRQLRSLNQAKLNLKNKRECLKLVHKGVQVEASKVNKKFRQDLGPDVSEDEGISSLDRTSICSSIDSRSNSVVDVFVDVAICPSPEMLPEAHLGVCSEDKPKQLHVRKEIETSKTDSVLKENSLHNQVITDLDISTDEDESPPERQKESQQNGAKLNNSWSLDSNLKKGEKHENRTSEFYIVDHKCQTNKILPLLDPSTKQSHSSAVGEHSLKSHMEQQKSLPILTLQSTENEGKEMYEMSLPSKLAENRSGSPSSGVQFQIQTECCKTMSSLNFIGKQYKSKEGFEKSDTQKMDYMEQENALQTDQDNSLQSSSPLSADTNNVTFEKNEVVPLVEISSPECENLSHRNAMLKIASEDQKQNAPKQEIRSIFDTVEMENCAPLQTKLKSCSSRPETVGETDTSVHEKLKKPEALLLVEHEDKQYMDDAPWLSTDDFTEDLIDNILQEMTWQHSLVSPLSNLTSVQGEESSCKENTSCSIAVGTEHLLCDVGVQTSEESSCKENASCSIAVGTEHLLCDVGVQTSEESSCKENTSCSIAVGTEHLLCDVGVQTNQRLHSKKNLIPVAVQTEIHDTYALRDQHTPTCIIDSPNTVHETPCRTVHTCRKNNTLETYMNPEIKESLSSAESCNLNQQSQWSGRLEVDTKERCCNMHNKCSRKDIFEDYDKLLAFHRQYLQLSFKVMEHQSNILTNSHNLLSSHSRMLPVFNCNVDHHIRDHYNKTSDQFDSKNADHLSSATHRIPSEPFTANSLLTSGDCLCCNKNLANKEYSMIDVDNNNSIIKSGSSVELKHENTDETSQELIYRDSSSRNHAHDREENVGVLENRVPDSNTLFGFISDLSSDDEKSSCKASKSDLTIRKRAVESDGEVLVEHSLPVKKMRKQRFKRIWIPSSDEDDLRTATNAENNKPAFKASTHSRTPTDTKRNKPAVKITLQCCSNDEHKEHSTGKLVPSKTVLKVAQTLKKSSKISKLERMRLNIVKAKTRVKIPRASPERMSQRLKKKSLDIDVEVSSPAKRPREVKDSCVSQSNAHSLASVLKATESKISRLLPSRMSEYESAESLQAREIPGSNTIASAKLSTQSSIPTFEMNTIESISSGSFLPLDFQVNSLARPIEVRKSSGNQSNEHSSQSVLCATAPKAISACPESKISQFLPGNRTDLESTKSSQTKQISGSNTTASAKLSLERSFQKFEANTENSVSHRRLSVSLVQPSVNNHVIIPLNSQRIHMNESADLVYQTELKQDEESTNCRSSFNLHSKTLNSLSNTPLSPSLAEAASPQNVNENEPGGSADNTEQQSHESISDVKNIIQKAEKDNEELPRGCSIQWALKLLQKEAQQERRKEVAYGDCSRIQQRVRKAIKELESETFDNEYLAFVVQELTVIDRACVVDFVTRGIVKAVETDTSLVDKTHTPPAPPLTVLQQRLMALTFTLHYEHQMFKELPEKILLAIEYKTLRLGSAPKMQECRKLVCFYSAVCRALKDVKRIQLYCLDALYSLHYKSAPILNTVLCTFPEALPHADKGKDIPLVKCLVFLIFTPVQYKKRISFSIKPLKDLLHQLYGYEPGEFNADQLLSFLLGKLRNEENKEVPIALILLAKRMSHEWAYRTLLCKNLIPLVNEWKAAKLQNSAFAKILPIMGYIVRCFPIGESRAFIEKVKYIFISIMEDENAPAEVQEGAVMGLLSLSRHNPSHIAGLLKNWQPKMKLSNKVVHKIAAFMQFRPLKFWTYYANS